MAIETDIQQVEGIIGYSFRTKNLLRRALTAAGAEESNYDGNRKLASYGTRLVSLLLSDLALELDITRGKPSDTV